MGAKGWMRRWFEPGGREKKVNGERGGGAWLKGEDGARDREEGTGGGGPGGEEGSRPAKDLSRAETD